MKEIRLTVIALAILLTTIPAAHAIRIYGATSPGNQSGSGAGLVDLGVDHNGNPIGPNLQFNIAKKTRVVITVSAECATDGDEGDWTTIDILANGVALGASSGTGDAFCSGNADPGNDGWVTASRSVQVEFTPGNYTIQVRAENRGGSAGWWVSDIDVAVIVQKK